MIRGHVELKPNNVQANHLARAYVSEKSPQLLA